ncbi:chemosensory receptor a [Plakobranchus ocellatus]|uniref:Chemosensory receptor a n=1 Tax=Plakobranchus ocellatus TaxID=259542 RepID=A0AAV3YIA3_9GAST|nr:chemosensory receptor a [Plakobranchus ocellatus]
MEADFLKLQARRKLRVMVLSLCPAYLAFRISWTFVEEENRTLYTLIVTNAETERITIAGNFILQVICFLGIGISNATLVYALQQKTKWRQGATAVTKPDASATTGIAPPGRDKAVDEDAHSATHSKSTGNSASQPGPTVRGGAADQAANRDRKLGRMIVLLSGIIFFCYIPSTVALLVQLVEPGFSMLGRYRNSFFAAWSFVWILDAFNSSVNIFVYYNMSSKYRATFNTLFGRCMRKWRVRPEAANGDKMSATTKHAPDKAANTRDSGYVTSERNGNSSRIVPSPETNNTPVLSLTSMVK